MKNQFVYVCASLLLLAGCSNPEKMKDVANQVRVSCEPSVLSATAGKVKATITVTFPDKYFDASAVLEMLPVVKYNGMERTLEAKVLQGEKVKDNNTVIRASGGSYSQDIEFDYNDAMSISSLEVRPTLIVKDKRIPFPQDFKAASGIIANYLLAEAEAIPVVLGDDYQKAAEIVKNAEIKFLINQTAVRPGELKKEDLVALRDFLLNDIAQAKNTKLKNLKISSYASPDGPLAKNEALSVGRGKAANTTINDLLKKSKSKSKYKLPADALKIEHTAEDWEGFQQLMEASSIADKQLVLRVLSMYSDPQVRETEIKNISKVYQEIAQTVLPELRRSKLVLTAEALNLSDEELKARIESNQLDALTAEQLLYSALNFYSDDVATQKSLYQYTADKYNDYRVLNNLGAIFLAEGNLAEARRVLESALALEPSNTHVNNNLGYIALAEGDNDQAEKFLLVAGLDASKVGLGHIAILKGNYSHAVTLLSDLKSVNSGLAFLLTGNLGKASAALSDVDEPTAYYILAIIAARNNDANGVKNNIAKAAAQDVTWKEKAKKNIEFAQFLPQIQ
ncbi:hypothetical protein FACS189452_01460 [Bacteroidia bacterium]|nr:hypothetical protein FACS189452_01460 [Bacteroidia bacterium]GHT81716.1 hypothetical protein FACS189467_6240 [Bacteroidia bacterium]